MMKLSNKGFTPTPIIKVPKFRNKLARGFTLIEVMIAAAILVTVICGILLIYINSLELISLSRNLTFSVNAAQRKVEEIRDYTFSLVYADYNEQVFAVDEMPPGNSRGVIYVDNSNPDLLQITISVCWRQRANRIIGEDLDLDGVLDLGEDLNGNNMIDSPAQLVTLITQR